MPNELRPDVPDMPDFGPNTNDAANGGTTGGGGGVTTGATTLVYLRAPLKSSCIGDNYLYVGDTLLGYADFITDADSKPFDATGLTVSFSMYPAAGGPPIVNAAAAVWLAAASALAAYQWQANDTATPGDYLLFWHVADSNGKGQTLPSNGGAKFTIKALGATT